MKTKNKALLTLAIMTPVITELLLGATPIYKFITPVMLIILCFAYSIPIVILRELSVRYRLSLEGIFTMGLAYGIFNEGVLSKTFMLRTSVPIAAFNNFGFFWGLNFAWIPMITLWHALHSVLFPLLFIRCLYPAVSGQPWLSKKATAVLSVLVGVFGIVAYFAIKSLSAEPKPHYLFLFAGFIVGLLWWARCMPTDETGITNEASPKAVNGLLLGFAYFLLFWIGCLPAVAISFAMFYCYVVILFVVVLLIFRKMRRMFELVYFAIASYMGLAFFGIIGMLSKGRALEVMTDVVFEIVFVVAIVKLWKKNSRGAPSAQDGFVQ